MEKEYRTLEEWRRTYKEKEKLLLERGFEEVSPHDFYRDLFPVGSLEEKGKQGSGKGNIVANVLLKTRRRKTIISDGLEDLDKIIGTRFGLIGPYSCFGKSYKQEYIHEVFAIVIDIDYVTKVHLKRLLQMFADYGNEKRYNRMPPTYLASSGRGLHLYYFLDKPIEMYKHREPVLTELKMALTRYLWNDFTSLKGDEPDDSSIAQGFRCVGSLSKICLDKEKNKIVTRAYPVKAYKISGRRYSLYELRDSIKGCNIDIDSLYQKPEPQKGKISLAEAKELYPDWYERRIVRKEPPKPHEKTWTCDTALYDWWLRTLQEKARVGGRYYAIVALCCYGRKCKISDAKIRKDAWKQYDLLEKLTDDEANHFSKTDMRDALSVLKDPDMMKTVKHTREWIEAKTKIEIPPNKRNGRKRAVHVEYMNMSRKFKVMQNECTNGGRPDKAELVENWQKAHPNGKKIDCEKETGLSRHTVLKWWK